MVADRNPGIDRWLLRGSRDAITTTSVAEPTSA
jgi:hypothetical protein